VADVAEFVDVALVAGTHQARQRAADPLAEGGEAVADLLPHTHFHRGLSSAHRNHASARRLQLLTPVHRAHGRAVSLRKRSARGQYREIVRKRERRAPALRSLTTGRRPAEISSLALQRLEDVAAHRL